MSRVLPGLALAGCWLLLLLQGSFLLFSLVMVVAFLGGREYTRMVLPSSFVGWRGYALATLITLPVLCAASGGRLPVAGGLLVSFFIVAAYILYRYNTIDEPYQLFSGVVFGLVYVGVLTAHLVLLHRLEHGHLWLIVLTAITAGSDTGAYYAGRRFGSHKLCPGISPKKTVEGAVGGLAGGLVCALFFGWLMLPGVNVLFLTGVALLLVVVGIGGDLTESVLKRAHGIKDSGTLLAGHGGILDRTDSLLFAGPVLYYLLLI